jgi:hypothetical protein
LSLHSEELALIDGPVGGAGTHDPSRVTSIQSLAFGNTGLTSVTIPANVTSIGVGAFSQSSALTEIAVDPANPNHASLQGVLANKAQPTLLEAPGAISSLTVPASVMTMAEGCLP